MRLMIWLMVCPFLVSCGLAVDRSTRNPDGTPLTENQLRKRELLNRESVRKVRWENHKKYEDLDYFLRYAAMAKKRLDVGKMDVPRGRGDFEFLEMVDIGLALSGSPITFMPTWMNVGSILIGSEEDNIRNGIRANWNRIHGQGLAYVFGRARGGRTLEAAIERTFKEAQRVVLSSPLGCEPVVARTGRPGFGMYIPDKIHRRQYFCKAFAGKVKPNYHMVFAYAEVIEPGTLAEAFGKPGDVLGVVQFYDLNKAPEYDTVDGARRVHTAIKERGALPRDCFAVWTGRDGEGRWRVFVEHGKVTHLLDPPPNPFRRRK